MDKKLVFVIEHCQNCSSHQWNTRHDEAKYTGFAHSVTDAIKSQIPEASVLINQVPKEWHEKDIYCSLIPNYDDNYHVYDMVGRMGAFEVSTVVEG